MTNAYRYTSRRYEAASATYYHRWRTYDAGVGRFPSRDPLRGRPQAYAYCTPNPVGFVDPYGEYPGLSEQLTVGALTFMIATWAHTFFKLWQDVAVGVVDRVQEANYMSLGEPVPEDIYNTCFCGIERCLTSPDDLASILEGLRQVPRERIRLVERPDWPDPTAAEFTKPWLRIVMAMDRRGVFSTEATDTYWICAELYHGLTHTGHYWGWGPDQWRTFRRMEHPSLVGSGRDLGGRSWEEWTTEQKTERYLDECFRPPADCRPTNR